MSVIWKQRLTAIEWMDEQAMDAQTAASVLKTLAWINYWLGGVAATLWHLERFSKRWIASQTIHILDWGTGGADIPRAIVHWARRKGHPVRIVGVDHNPQIAASAREACRDYPEIEIMEMEAGRFNPPDHSFDYAISSLTLHHLNDDQIVSLLQQSNRIARRGILMNDLKRSARAWAWIWAISRLTFMPAMVRHDGPLSVRRAFSLNDFQRYAQQAGLPYLKVTSHFGHRLTLAGQKG